jgi:hypothetical protein
MEYRIRTQPKEWACTRFCRIDLDGHSVWQFLLWLCDHIDDDVDRSSADKADKVVWYDPIENTWGWDAPRQRMAKLLWQKMQNASEDEFYGQFSFGLPYRWNNSAELLAPIQDRRVPPV